MIHLTKRAGYLAEWSHDGGATWSMRHKLFYTYEAAINFAREQTASLDVIFRECRAVLVMVDEDGKLWRQEEQQDGDSDSVLCPHCKEQNDDMWELLGTEDEASCGHNCQSCGKPMVVSCSVTVTYSASALVPFKPEAGE